MASAINTDSLVKYETAILVSSSFTSNKSPSKKKALPAKDAARNEDYLNRILPPQEIIENNQLWVRYVSPTPATSADVSNLRKELDRKLESLGARDSGICPVREELHIQCFDELIRQITINCAERGYLLVRVRDEFRMVKHSLQSLYDSSIAYGLKKALMGEAEKEAMKTRQLQLEKENRDLQDQIQDFEEQIKVRH